MLCVLVGFPVALSNKYMTNSKLGRKGSASAYRLRSIIERSQGRSSGQALEAESVEEHHFVAGSASFTYAA